MSKFKELISRPPKFIVKKNAREVIIKLVSCMCDNRYEWSMKKNAEGDFKLCTSIFAFSNFQTRFNKSDIEWEADDSNWDKVFFMINSGTSRVESIKSR